MTDESLTVEGAARILGLSPRTVKRLARDGRLPHFLTPGGHFRFRRAELEAFAKGGNLSSPVAAAGSAVTIQSRRERVEGLRLDAEELRAQRELRRLQAEDEEAEQRRRADAEAVTVAERRETERLRLETAREAAARKQAAHDAATQRRRGEWLAEWTEYALSVLPSDAPPNVALDARQAVAEALADADSSEPESLTRRLVAAAVAMSLEPWRRSKEIEKVIEESAQQLPAAARSWDRKRPTEWQTRAMRAATDAIEQLDSTALLGRIRAAAFEAAEGVCAEYQKWRVREHHQESCDLVLACTVPPRELTAEERDAAARAVRDALAKLPLACGLPEMHRARDAALAPFNARAEAIRAADRYLRHVSDYIEELGDERTGEWDLGSFSERARLAEKLRTKLRPDLIRELLKTELDEHEVHEFIQERVDEVLGLDEE